MGRKTSKRPAKPKQTKKSDEILRLEAIYRKLAQERRDRPGNEAPEGPRRGD